MAQPEAMLVRKIKDYLKDIPETFTFKIHGSPFMLAGLPDLIVCHSGMFYGIEAKMPGNVPTKRQRYIHQKIKQARGTIIVAYSVDDVREMIKRESDREPRS